MGLDHIAMMAEFEAKLRQESVVEEPIVETDEVIETVETDEVIETVETNEAIETEEILETADTEENIEIEEVKTLTNLKLSRISEEKEESRRRRPLQNLEQMSSSKFEEIADASRSTDDEYHEEDVVAIRKGRPISNVELLENWV